MSKLDRELGELIARLRREHPEAGREEIAFQAQAQAGPRGLARPARSIDTSDCSKFYFRACGNNIRQGIHGRTLGPVPRVALVHQDRGID